MRILLSLALAASLPACTFDAPRSAGAVAVQADLTLDQVEARYAQVKAVATFAKLFLKAPAIAKIEAIEAKVDAAIAKARAAITVLEQYGALHEAMSAIEKLDQAAAN